MALVFQEHDGDKWVDRALLVVAEGIAIAESMTDEPAEQFSLPYYNGELQRQVFPWEGELYLDTLVKFGAGPRGQFVYRDLG